jgi:hypothetical protein
VSKKKVAWLENIYCNIVGWSLFSGFLAGLFAAAVYGISPSYHPMQLMGLFLYYVISGHFIFNKERTRRQKLIVPALAYVGFWTGFAAVAAVAFLSSMDAVSRFVQICRVATGLEPVYLTHIYAADPYVNLFAIMFVPVMIVAAFMAVRTRDAAKVRTLGCGKHQTTERLPQTEAAQSDAAGGGTTIYVEEADAILQTRHHA